MNEEYKQEHGTVEKIGDKITTRGVPTGVDENGKRFFINPPCGCCDCCHKDIDDLPNYDIGNPSAIKYTGTKLLKTFLNDSPDGDSSISAYWLCTDCMDLVESSKFYEKMDQCFEDKYKHQAILEIPDDRKKEIFDDARLFQKKYLVKDRKYYDTFFNIEGLEDDLSFDEGHNLRIRIRSSKKENIEEFLEYLTQKYDLIEGNN